MTDGGPDFSARLFDHGTARAIQSDVLLCRRQHAAIEVEDAGAGAAGADIYSDDKPRVRYVEGRVIRSHGSLPKEALGSKSRRTGAPGMADWPQRSTAFGRITRSRMVTLRGRVSMKSTASATSFGCIRLPD